MTITIMIMIMIMIIIDNSNNKTETEGLIMAAQTQSLRTNVVKAHIDNTQDDPLCRICRQKEENVSHLLSQCPKLAITEYK